MDMRHNLPDGHPAYAETMSAVRAEQRREAYVEFRERELVQLLARHPLSVRPEHAVVSYYGRSSGRIPVGADLAGWVIDYAIDAEQTLAEVAYSQQSRDKLHREYAYKRACDEAERMDEDGEFSEAA